MAEEALGRLPEQRREGVLPFEIRSLPEPPAMSLRSITRWAGPAVILGALSVGGFEAYQAGYMGALTFQGIFWVYLVSCAFQLLLNREIARYTMATGETLIQGMARMPNSKFWSWFTAVFAFVQTGSPAWIGGAAAGAAALIGGAPQIWGMFAIALVFILFATSGVVYSTLEKIMFAAFVVATLGVIVLTSMMSPPQAWGTVAGGWLSFGVIPAGIAIWAIGPFLNQPAGGFWNFWHTYWVRERQMGMAAHMGRVTGLTAKPEDLRRSGYTFDTSDPKELKKFSGWMRLNVVSLGIFFILLGGILFTYFISLAGYSATTFFGMKAPDAGNQQVAIIMASIFESAFGPVAFAVFCLVIVFALFDSQFSIYDGIARMFSDVAYIQHPKSLGRRPYRFWYFVVLGILVVYGMAAVWVGTPYLLWVASNWLGNLACAFVTVMTIYLNRKVLPKGIRPGNLVTALNLFWAVVVAAYFVLWTINSPPKLW